MQTSTENLVPGSDEWHVNILRRDGYNAAASRMEQLAEIARMLSADDPNIYKESIMIMSTAHVTKETFEFLNGGIYPISFVNDEEFGKVIRITEDDLEDTEYPEDLLTIMVFANSHNCAYIRLDCDAPICEGLPTYDW